MELLELRWEHVDLEVGMFRIVNSKTRAGRRTLRMTRETREVLARRLQDTTRVRGARTLPPDAQSLQGANGVRSPWVFPSNQKPGEHLTPLQHLHDLVLADCGLSFVIYDLRHSWATRAVERGLSLPEIQAVLGHSSLRCVMRYIHMGQHNLDAAMAKFDAAQAPAVEPVIVVERVQ